MEVSSRHAKRLLAGYGQRGAEALAHDNRGRLPFNKIDPLISKQVIGLSKSKYSGFNQTHLSEKLREQEGKRISLEHIFSGLMTR